jgi:hypothetical protein
MTAGRNDPCPCGSGKKYKRCCLPADEQASRPPGQDWHDLDQRISNNIGQWAKRRFGAVWETCADDYPIDFEDREEHIPLFFAWATCERKIEGRPAASWYLEERGRHLMARERDWLEAQLRSWLSIWEVLEVDPGKSIRLKDLLTGEERMVSEVSGSRNLERHLLLLARVVDYAGLSLLIGSHPQPLPPVAGQEALAQFREEMELGKRVSAAELREGDRPTYLIDVWEEAVEALRNRPFPQMRNTDGEDLVLIKDHYKLVGADARTSLEAELAKMPDVQPPEPGKKERRYTVMHEDRNRRTGQTLIASIVVKAREVVVETNSRERADQLRARMEATFGDCLRFGKREQESADDMMAKMPARARKVRPPLQGPEIDAALRQFKTQHYATWPDTSLPAFDGLTPREAAAQPKYRARLDTLLKEMEYHESREEPARRFDFGPIRRELGLG